MSETSTSPFDFDAFPAKSEQVKYKGVNYVLREATAEAARVWRNTLLKMTRPSVDGTIKSMEGVGDLETLLVSLCLFKVVTDPDGSVKEVPVSLQTVRSWPNPIVRKLFEAAREMSGLVEKDDESTASNGQTSQSTATSSSSEEESEARPSEAPKRRTMWG